MRTIIAGLFLSLVAFAQDSGPVFTKLLYYDASSNLEYVCTARAVQATWQYTRADSTITNIVDSSNTATATVPNHGLSVGNLITVSGATVDTDLNGTYYVQTVTDANTFTFTSASVSDATYTDATLVISGTAARNTQPIWEIQKLIYSGTVATHIQTSIPNSICANRATTTGTTKITWR